MNFSICFKVNRFGEKNSIFKGALLKGLSAENANDNGEVNCDLVFNVIDNELKDSGQEPIRMGLGRSITLVKYKKKFSTIGNLPEGKEPVYEPPFVEIPPDDWGWWNKVWDFFLGDK